MMEIVLKSLTYENSEIGIGNFIPLPTVISLNPGGPGTRWRLSPRIEIIMGIESNTINSLSDSLEMTKWTFETMCGVTYVGDGIITNVASDRTMILTTISGPGELKKY